MTTFKKEVFRELWNYNKKLDRYLVIIQSLFIVSFIYREQIFLFFAIIAIISFFIMPIMYLSKGLKAAQLNRMIYDLVKNKQIPKWILLRRIIINISYLFMSGPGLFIFILIFISIVKSSLAHPIFLTIIFSLPWLFLEIINKKEHKYFKQYL